MQCSAIFFLFPDELRVITARNKAHFRQLNGFWKIGMSEDVAVVVHTHTDTHIQHTILYNPLSLKFSESTVNEKKVCLCDLVSFDSYPRRA